MNKEYVEWLNDRIDTLSLHIKGLCEERDMRELLSQDFFNRLVDLKSAYKDSLEKYKELYKKE